MGREEKDKILVVDGTNLAWRSIHAIRPGSKFNEGVTGPLVLFYNTLSRYVKQERPDGLVVCWEGGKSQFRKRLLPQYKENRKPNNIPLKEPGFRLIREFLTLSHISQGVQEGYEADDLIAAVVHHYKQTHKVVILSADKDLLQLLHPNVTQVRFGPSGTKPDMWTEWDVLKEFGCMPKRLPLLMALMGDKSDNIPGIEGIGPKKGLKILKDGGWDLENNAHKALEVNRETVLLSHRLIDLLDPEDPAEVPSVAFNPVVSGHPDWEPLSKFLLDHKLKRMYDAAKQGTLWR